MSKWFAALIVGVALWTLAGHALACSPAPPRRLEQDLTGATALVLGRIVAESLTEPATLAVDAYAGPGEPPAEFQSHLERYRVNPDCSHGDRVSMLNDQYLLVLGGSPSTPKAWISVMSNGKLSTAGGENAKTVMANFASTNGYGITNLPERPVDWSTAIPFPPPREPKIQCRPLERPSLARQMNGATALAFGKITSVSQDRSATLTLFAYAGPGQMPETLPLQVDLTQIVLPNNCSAPTPPGLFAKVLVVLRGNPPDLSPAALAKVPVIPMLNNELLDVPEQASLQTVLEEFAAARGYALKRPPAWTPQDAASPGPLLAAVVGLMVLAGLAERLLRAKEG